MRTLRYAGGGVLCAASLLLATIAPARTQTAPRPLDPAGLRREIAAHPGKVVVLNLWGTWCAPCVAEFPALVQFANAHHSRGLDLVTLSFDEAPDVPKKVVPFLNRNKLTLGIFVNKGGATVDEAYIDYLEPKLPKDMAFALPRTYIFDRKGKLAKVLTGEQTRASLEKAIAGVL